MAFQNMTKFVEKLPKKAMWESWNISNLPTYGGKNSASIEGHLENLHIKLDKLWPFILTMEQSLEPELWIWNS